MVNRKPGSSRPRPPRPQADQDTPANGDILPPGASSGIPPALYAEIIAQINQYTDRPDLLIEVIERHDPGFIKQMNEESREFSRKSRDAKFTFGRVQAYSSLLVQLMAAFGILYILYVMAVSKTLGFTVILGFGILFAITQSGMTGFLKIIDQIKNLLKAK